MKFKEFFSTIKEGVEDIFPKVVDILQKQKNPLVGIHFSNGVPERNLQLTAPFLLRRIKPPHHDPIGIYCFPKDYVLNNEIIKNSFFAKMKFIYVIAPNQNAKVLNLNMSEEKAKQLLDEMEIGREYYDNSNIFHKGVDKAELAPGHRFWGCIEYYRHEKNLSKNFSWNILFKKTGYNVLYDPGLKIIHGNEPTQIVYLENNTYDIIDVLQNNPHSFFLSKLKETFPQFKIRRSNFPISFNKKGGTFYFSYYNISFSVEISENLLNHSGIVVNYKNDKLIYNNNPIDNFSFSGDSKNYFFNDFNKLISKLKELIGDNIEISSEFRPVDVIIRKISKLYKLKSEKDRIVRNYGKDIYGTEYNITLIITATTPYKLPSSSVNSEPTLDMRFYSRPKQKIITGQFRYDLSASVPIKKDASASETLNELFDEAIKEFENYSRIAVHDLNIIRKKTFPPHIK